MSSLWRLQTNTDSLSGMKKGKYCIDNKVLAMGWSINDAQLKDNSQKSEITTARKNIQSFEDYENIIKKYNPFGEKYKVNENVRRLYEEVKEDDLVWIREDGLYYLGQVSSSSKWKYVGKEEELAEDIANQLSDVKWFKVGDESCVAGGIATALIRGKTLQRIWKDGMIEYSKLLFNELTQSEYYKDIYLKAENREKLFYSLLSPTECEDLLCLWLYYKKGYICIPSTNKTSTELYECVLKDPINGKRIFPQVKASDELLDAKKYYELSKEDNCEVWLFTTLGKVINIPNNSSSIFVANPKELFEFVESDIAQNILPQSILNWNNISKKFIK